MKYHSTNQQSLLASLEEAIMTGLAPDGGLYMPEYIPRLPDGAVDALPGKSFRETAGEIASAFLDQDLPSSECGEMVQAAYDFEAPLKKISPNLYVLELFHGPTLAFKDFGARFMAQLMSYFARRKRQKLTILVATSGDTGGAIASGFFLSPGIDVVILYPSGKVSPLQEKQLTTWGENIQAMEVLGTFDDCQRIVKEAFLDEELRGLFSLTSANSINIGRLIPQVFYYAAAWAALALDCGNERAGTAVFSVPSGNFGNLTAGLIAKRMGIPIAHFVAATNINRTVPDYLAQGLFSPRASVATISNAMDVGNPSNFARMAELYGGSVDAMRKDISAFSFTDDETRKAIRTVEGSYGYTLDPHSAVGFLALNASSGRLSADRPEVLVATAHPAKFREVVSAAIGRDLLLPPALEERLHLPKQAAKMRPALADLKRHLKGRP